jgi:hypothetical protein
MTEKNTKNMLGVLAAATIASTSYYQEYRTFTDETTYFKGERQGTRSTISSRERSKRTAKKKQAKKQRRRNRK